MTLRADGPLTAFLHDRRKDWVMADLVDVGLLYVHVFGRDRGLSYFRCTVVAPHVYRRVLLGTHRLPQPRGNPDDLEYAG
jgi:hypothetical protein